MEQTTSTTETPNPESSSVQPEASWEGLGLSEEALELIRKAGFSKPTPIQVSTLPVALEGRDVIGSAQTGTGKTACFVLPMVERFAGREGTFGLILAPTREIAQQIQATIELFGHPRGVRSCVLIGGVDMRYDAQALAAYPQIIVATPGRLCDHLDRGNIWLEYIEICVLDEADKMLDMGFAAQLSRITDDLPQDRQTMLFSATIPPPVERLANKILHDPVRVAVAKPLAAASTVEQRLIWLAPEAKMSALHRIIREEPGSIIVFTRSKEGATQVWRKLHSNGVYDATYIHSDRLQSHREQALADFKAGTYRILIATDVAGRGIHVDDVAHVVNYDLPMEAEDYVHRIGRTGRAGQTGKATTFATQRDRAGIRAIEKILGSPIPSVGGREEPSERRPEQGQEPRQERGEESRGRRGRRGGRGRSGQGQEKRESEPSRAGAQQQHRVETQHRDDTQRRDETQRREPRQSHGGRPQQKIAPVRPTDVIAKMQAELGEDFYDDSDEPSTETSETRDTGSRDTGSREPREGGEAHRRRRRRRGGRGRRKPGGPGGGSPSGSAQ